MSAVQPSYSKTYHLFNVSLCVCLCVTDVRSRSSRSSGHLEGPGPIQQVQHPLSVSGEENEYHYTQRKQSIYRLMPDSLVDYALASEVAAGASAGSIPRSSKFFIRVFLAY